MPRETGKASMVLDVRIIFDRNATTASVTLLSEPVLNATGAAKRMPGDVHNKNIGIDLAVGRALTAMGELLTSRGAVAVSNAALRQQARAAAREARLARVIRARDIEKGKIQMPVAVIAERYGVEAAARAAERRGLQQPVKPFQEVPPGFAADAGHE